MYNEHPIYRIIKSLKPAEKTYFKKYAFKRVNKNNDSFKRLFDIIDKQVSFDLDKLKSDKKVNSNVKKEIHVNLNLLQKKIMSSILEYRKNENELSKIFENILEFEFYKERKLFSLAENKLKTLDKFTNGNDYFLLKPFIANLPFDVIRSQVNKDSKKMEHQVSLFESSIEEVNVLSATMIIGFGIWRLMHLNSGLSIDLSIYRKDVEELLNKTEELLKLERKDFQFRSILTNNLFILTIMSNKTQNLESISKSLINFYKENAHKERNSKSIYDFLIVLVNVSFYGINLGQNDVYLESLDILRSESDKLHSEMEKQSLAGNLMNLELLHYVYIKEEILESEIEYFKSLNDILDRNTVHYVNYVYYFCIVLLKNKEYELLLDFSSDRMQMEEIDAYKTNFYKISYVRALAWLKEENLQMVAYELNASYNYFKNRENNSVQLLVINYIKKLLKKPQKKEKIKLMEKFEFDYKNATQNIPVAQLIASNMALQLLRIEHSLTN